MSLSIRFSHQTFDLLGILLEQPRLWRYGYDLSRVTGLKSGTLYPILMRLAGRGWLETRWEVVENGKPPRHMYRLTPDGLQFAKEEIKLRQPQGARRLSWSGAKA
jgi:DNA-binding PadR family transcriptional regulator